jgi:hypothetical protein
MEAIRTRTKFLLNFLFLLLLLLSSSSLSVYSFYFFKGGVWIGQFAALSEVQKLSWSSHDPQSFITTYRSVPPPPLSPLRVSHMTSHIFFTWRQYFRLLRTHRVNTLSVMGPTVQSIPPKKSRNCTSWSAWALPCQKVVIIDVASCVCSVL